MKIVVDIREFKSDNFTGSARFLKLFLNHLKEEERGEILLLADQNTDTTRYEGIFNIKKEISPLVFWYDQVIVPNIIRREKVDLYFSPNYKIPFFSGNCKKVMTLYDLSFLSSILRKGVSRFLPYFFYINKAVRMASKVITVSEFSKKEIIRKFAIENEKVRVVYIGIDPQFRILNRKESSTLEFKYGINSEYLLYVANMKPHKNILGLIKSYNLLDDDKKNRYKLIIIAKQDKHYGALRDYVFRLGLEKNILFIDYVPDEDLVLFYNFASIFIFPSFLEGFGLPPLEAMACGSPVISSHTTSLKEVLKDNVLYVDPYDTNDICEKLSQLLDDSRLREDLRNRGLNYVKQFDASSFARKLLSEIKDTH